MAGSDSTAANPQLAAYRCLLDNACAMLQAAREERWDDMSDLNLAREACLADVKQADLVSTVPADAVAQTELIQRILECDEQTQSLVHARKIELAEVLGSWDNERKLADAYR